MRLRFASRNDAQAWADKTHAQMIAGFPAYAKSAADRQTERWAIPAEDAGAYVCGVKDRVRPTMTAQEVARIEETPKDLDPKPDVRGR